jgi:hypothetical protein
MLVSVLNDKSATSTIGLLCRWVINNGNCNLCSSITTKFRMGLLQSEMSVSSETTLPFLMGYIQYVKVVTLRNRKSYIYIYIYMCVCVYTHIYVYVYTYTECNRRNGPNFGRLFLMLNYTEKTQNTYIQSWTVTEIKARETCGQLRVSTHFTCQLTV